MSFIKATGKKAGKLINLGKKNLQHKRIAFQICAICAICGPSFVDYDRH